MRVKDARQTFLGIWIRLALQGKPFEVWGGEQLRDFTFVDDAVEAFLAAVTPATASRTLHRHSMTCQKCCSAGFNVRRSQPNVEVSWPAITAAVRMHSSVSATMSSRMPAIPASA